MTALVVGLAVAVLLLAVLVAGLLRAHSEVLRVLHQMEAERDRTPADTQAGRQEANGPQ